MNKIEKLLSEVNLRDGVIEKKNESCYKVVFEPGVSIIVAEALKESILEKIATPEYEGMEVERFALVNHPSNPKHLPHHYLMIVD